MKRLAIFLLAGAAALCAQPMNSGERNYVLSHFHATRKLFQDSIAGLSPAQWKYKPAADRWSIAEVAEHIVVSEDMMFGELEKFLAGPAGAPRKVDRSEDEKILQLMTDRSQKRKAPEGFQPSGRWSNAEEMAREFRTRRDRTIEYLNTTGDDLRSRVRGEKLKFDAYQFLLMLSGHVERHVAQIDEVKSAAGFPK